MFLSCICLQDSEFDLDRANQDHKKPQNNNKFCNKRIKLDRYEMGTVDLSTKDTDIDDVSSFDVFSQKLLDDIGSKCVRCRYLIKMLR